MDVKTLHNIFLQSEGVSTDTRTINKNQIFFALKGDNFDGNKYASLSIEKGASYAVIDNPEFKIDENYLLVDDVLQTLQKLAEYHRKYLNIPVLGITGTNGKTTTKELINAVLKKKFKTFATQGNLNNHIGVPLTLLSMDKNIEFGVVEMGANHPGEIKTLASIAQPDYGLITNIGTAHLEGFGSFEGVKKTKNELYQYIAQNGGRLFVNADDELLMELSENIPRVLYGKNADQLNRFSVSNNDVFLSILWNNDLVSTNLVGAYNFYNVLAAINIGLFFEILKDDIIEAIVQYEPRNNRSQFQKTAKNKLIVDVYNANPVSMQNAIQNFSKIAVENKLLILGDMFELGKYSKDEHYNIIHLVQDLGFDSAYFVGNEFYRFKHFNSPYLFFENIGNLLNYLKKNTIENNYILLKASRGIKLEQVIPYL